MPIKAAKKLLDVKPVSLTETQEHKVHKRKWWAISILVIGGVMLAAKLPVPFFIAYILLFFGHAGMFHSFWDKRDVPMMILNIVWMIIDFVGMIRWF